MLYLLLYRLVYDAVMWGHAVCVQAEDANLLLQLYLEGVHVDLISDALGSRWVRGWLDT